MVAGLCGCLFCTTDLDCRLQCQVGGGQQFVTGGVVQDTHHNAVSHHVRLDPCEISLARRTGTSRTGRTELVFHKITRVKQLLQGSVEPVKQFPFLLCALIPIQYDQVLGFFVGGGKLLDRLQDVTRIRIGRDDNGALPDKTSEVFIKALRDGRYPGFLRLCCQVLAPRKVFPQFLPGSKL